MKTAKKVSPKGSARGARGTGRAQSRQRAITRAVEDAVSEAIANGQPAGSVATLSDHAGEAAQPARRPPRAGTPAGGPGNGGLRDVETIRVLARVVHEFDIAELELEVAGDRLRLRRGALPATTVAVAAPAYAAPMVAPSAPAYVPAAAAQPAPAPAARTDGPAAARSPETFIVSPFVGTFYRSPSPEAPPFVEVGTVVKKGQPLCIIEAMKLMNEIEAEHDGRIMAVLAQNGQPVEYGEKLFSIDVTG
jgi:acetyl-CoA carboxylase biotin carboxyl carrier protein